MILSIITVNKNNSAGLEKTIQSVICQTSSDFEYIIIDGASDDNSVEIIIKYSNKINYWMSEPDTGIYNAMNKGIRKATGDYCLFLNSGDWLITPKTIDNVLKEIDGRFYDIYYSDKIKANNIIETYPDNMTINFLLNCPISHQNSLIKRSLFLEHGFYNENLRIVSDWEFFLSEIWKYKSSFSHIKTNISVFDIQGISSQKKEFKNRYAEHLILYKNVFQELSDTIIEYKDYKRSAYFYIISNYGETKLLSLILKLYKKTLELKKRIVFVFKKNQNKTGN